MLFLSLSFLSFLSFLSCSVFFLFFHPFFAFLYSCIVLDLCFPHFLHSFFLIVILSLNCCLPLFTIPSFVNSIFYYLFYVFFPLSPFLLPLCPSFPINSFFYCLLFVFFFLFLLSFFLFVLMFLPLLFPDFSLPHFPCFSFPSSSRFLLFSPLLSLFIALSNHTQRLLQRHAFPSSRYSPFSSPHQLSLSSSFKLPHCLLFPS